MSAGKQFVLILCMSIIILVLMLTGCFIFEWYRYCKEFPNKKIEWGNVLDEALYTFDIIFRWLLGIFIAFTIIVPFILTYTFL